MARFKYIISLILLTLTSVDSYSQKGEFSKNEENIYAQEEVKEPLVFKGVKFGVNVARFTDFYFKPDRRSSEIYADFNLSNKYFGVIEAGLSEINSKKDNYSYFSEGYFIKVGADFNMLKKYPTDYFGLGVRIGMADYKQSASNITFNDSRWAGNALTVDSKAFNTYWLEITFGLKGEVLKNLYLGWSALVRVGISGRKDAQFQPYDIPGYGNGTSGVNLGANYYIYYQIPFNKNK